MNELGDQVEKFIRKHNGEVLEIETVKSVLSRAKSAYTLRNALAMEIGGSSIPKTEACR